MICQSLTANVLRKRSIELVNLTRRSYKSSAGTFVCFAFLCLSLITIGLTVLYSGRRVNTGALDVTSVGRNQSSTTSAAIPFSELGAKATADYKGDGIGITLTAEGARLRTDFQKLSAVVS